MGGSELAAVECGSADEARWGRAHACVPDAGGAGACGERGCAEAGGERERRPLGRLVQGDVRVRDAR